MAYCWARWEAALLAADASFWRKPTMAARRVATAMATAMRLPNGLASSSPAGMSKSGMSMVRPP
jgi:hypothetical protein